MTNCKTCNEPIETSYTSAYGGDYYYSCNICDWHSEGDGYTMIKQGLTLEELIAHKKRLNKLHKDIHNDAVKTEDWVKLNVLREIMDELLTTGLGEGFWYRLHMAEILEVKARLLLENKEGELYIDDPDQEAENDAIAEVRQKYPITTEE